MNLLRVEWLDLLRVPFLEDGDDPAVGLDCWGQAREVCRRAGVPFPDIGRSEAARYFELLPRWSEVGDLLASDPTKKGRPSHVAVVVDVALGLALSTSVRAGPFCWPIHRASSECGVWRVRQTVGTG